MNTQIQESYNLYINGQWVPASDGKTFKAYNPANGDVLSVPKRRKKTSIQQLQQPTKHCARGVSSNP